MKNNIEVFRKIIPDVVFNQLDTARKHNFTPLSSLANIDNGFFLRGWGKRRRRIVENTEKIMYTQIRLK